MEIVEDIKVLNYRGLSHLVERLKAFFIKNPKNNTAGKYLKCLDEDGNVAWSNFPAFLKFKGTVTDIDALPSVGDEGDVYKVESVLSEYFWNSDTEEWEYLGNLVNLTTHAAITDTNNGGLVLVSKSVNGEITYEWKTFEVNTDTQADWNESNITSAAYILNKPSLNFLPLTGGTLTGLVYFDESAVSSSTVTCTKKYNWLNVSSPDTTISLSIAAPSSLEGPCEVIYAIKNGNSSGGSNITLNLPTELTGGTLHNMIGMLLFSIAPGKIAEIVFTFWSTTEVSFNGGLEE